MTIQPAWYDLVTWLRRHASMQQRRNCEAYTLFFTETMEGSSRVALDADWDHPSLPSGAILTESLNAYKSGMVARSDLPLARCTSSGEQLPLPCYMLGRDFELRFLCSGWLIFGLYSFRNV